MSARPRALTPAELEHFPLPPVQEADKNAHGRLLLVAGSRETPGSAAIAATAALRSGCGKVTIATVEGVAPHVALAVPEARVLRLPQGRDGGFARAADLTAADVLTDVGDAQPLVAAEAKAVEHMNTDHAEALRLYATRLLGAPDGNWRCVGIDPEGLDLQQGSTALRLAFPQHVTAPAMLRDVLKQLAEAPRARG